MFLEGESAKPPERMRLADPPLNCGYGQNGCLHVYVAGATMWSRMALAVVHGATALFSIEGSKRNGNPIKSHPPSRVRRHQSALQTLHVGFKALGFHMDGYLSSALRVNYYCSPHFLKH